MSFGRFFAALREQVPDLAFRFTEPHVENLRTLHTEEEFGMILTGFLPDLQPQIMRGGLAQQRLATSRRTVEQETFRHRMIEAFEKLGVQEWHFDGIANALHGFRLAANVLPQNRLDPSQRAIQPLRGADHFHGDALVGIETDLQSRLELVFRQKRRANHDQVRNARFVADPDPAVGEQFDNLDDRAVLIEPKGVGDGEGFVQEDAGSGIECRFGNCRIQIADVVGAVGTHQGPALRQFLQQGAETKRRRTELVDSFAEFFHGVARLVLQLFHFLDPTAQLQKVGRHRALHRNLVGNQIEQLKSGKFG